MKKMIFAAAAAFALALTGCEQEYLGPSADEIANLTVSKEDASQNAQQIGQAHTSFVNQLDNYGEITVGTKMSSWGQSGAAYTLKVNTATSNGSNFYLPSEFKWETTSTANTDIKFSGSNQLTIASESKDKTAAFKFTYTSSYDNAKKIEGTLTVTTEFDVTKADIASLKSSFESSVGLNSGDVTATKPIANLGQTDAAYTVTSKIGNVSLSLSKTISAGNSTYKVEWKATIPTGFISSSSASSYSTQYNLSNSDATAKTATFMFKIINGNDSSKTIQGIITVTVNTVALTAAEQEAQRLESFKTTFANWPGNYSSGSNIELFWADTPISAWAQTGAKYTAQVKPSSYSTLFSLPTATGLTWTAPATAVAGIDTSNISYGSIDITNSSLANASNPITLTFSGTSGTTPTKTVSGTLVLTVIKQ